MTLADDLTAIETAITSVLENGQETSTADGKTLKRASLQDLYKQKSIIEADIAKADSSKAYRTVAEY